MSELYDSDDYRIRSRGLTPVHFDPKPRESPLPFLPPHPPSSSSSSGTDPGAGRRKAKSRRRRRKRKDKQKSPEPAEGILLNTSAPHHPEIATIARDNPLTSSESAASSSTEEEPESEEEPQQTIEVAADRDRADVLSVNSSVGSFGARSTTDDDDADNIANHRIPMMLHGTGGGPVAAQMPASLPPGLGRSDLNAAQASLTATQVLQSLPMVADPIQQYKRRTPVPQRPEYRRSSRSKTKLERELAAQNHETSLSEGYRREEAAATGLVQLKEESPTRTRQRPEFCPNTSPNLRPFLTAPPPGAPVPVAASDISGGREPLPPVQKLIDAVTGGQPIMDEGHAARARASSFGSNRTAPAPSLSPNRTVRPAPGALQSPPGTFRAPPLPSPRSDSSPKRPFTNGLSPPSGSESGRPVLSRRASPRNQPNGYPRPPTLPSTSSSSGTGTSVSADTPLSQPTPAEHQTSAEPPTNGTSGFYPPIDGYRCKYDGCKAPPFATPYLLNSHANVHSHERPYYCSVEGCPRGAGGRGFKRKNELIRHGLVHSSPGYVCPYCPDREHRYPRPDNLQRHVRMHHEDKPKDDPLLREVLSQRPAAGGAPSSRGRRKRGPAS